MSDDQDIRVSLEHEGGYGFRVRFDLPDLPELHTDEAPPLGAGSGPNPSRLLMAAVGNCLAASLLFALRKFKNEPSGLRAEVSGKLMRNPDGRWRLPKLYAELHLPGQAPDYQQLDRILDQFEEFCIVTQSVRQGIDVDVTVRDGEGRVLRGDKSFEAGA